MNNPTMNNPTTSRLMDILKSADDTGRLTAYMEGEAGNFFDMTSAEYLCNMISEHKMEKAAVIAGSGIERTYGYQILNGLKNPGREKTVALCLAAGCDLKETQRALEISGAGILYPKRKRDAILIFALSKGLSVMETNALLDEFEDPALG